MNKKNPILDMQPTRESFIMYAAWYTCIATFGAKTQALALKAICEYALFNIPVPKIGFSPTEYAALMTFIPILDSNKKKYENGKKGAMHGVKGGRPKKDETPVGLFQKNPNVNINEMVKVTDNQNVDGIATGFSTPTYDYIYTLLLPVFFFKNCDARREIKRFYNHYQLADWRLFGGDVLNTDRRLLVAAERWKVEDEKPYLPPRFIAVWREVYEMAPSQLKKDVVEIVATTRMATGITIVCSGALHQWLIAPEVHANVTRLVHEKIAKTFKLDIISRATADQVHS